VFLHYGNSEDICSGKDPASSRGSLIRDWGTFEGDLDIKHLLIGVKRVGLVDDIVELVVAESRECQAVLSIKISGCKV
jgi:hypothetical protein